MSQEAAEADTHPYDLKVFKDEKVFYKEVTIEEAGYPSTFHKVNMYGSSSSARSWC